MPNRMKWLKTTEELKQARSYTGGLNGIRGFLDSGCLDVVRWHDDFLGDTIRGDATAPGLYEVVTGVDGAINILADQENGIAEIRASDGNGADNEYCGVSLPELAWSGDQYCWMVARVAVDAITTVKMEIGFTDVTTDAGAVATLATPTFTADDCALWVFDTDDTAYWQCAGCKATTAATKIEDGLAPVAGTFEYLGVALEDTSAKFFRLDANGRKTYESAWMADAITKTVQLVPWIFVQLRTGTIDRNISLDMLHVEQMRTNA
ncbi:MAG: hypothetical protein WC359_14050 [Dehalococcoidia bacterium]